MLNTDYNGIDFDGSPFSGTPIWLLNAIELEKIAVANADTDYACWDIITLEGVMRAIPGDYIIKGVKGEFYPCKPDIFEETYEPVDTKEQDE